MNTERHPWLRTSRLRDPDRRRHGVAFASCAFGGLLASLTIGAAFANGFGSGAPGHPPHGGGGGHKSGYGQGTGTKDDGSLQKAWELFRARNTAVGLIREMAIVDQFPPAVYIQFKEVYLDWAYVASQADVEPIPFDEWLWQVGIEDPDAFKALMTFFVVTELIVDKIMNGG